MSEIAMKTRAVILLVMILILAVGALWIVYKQPGAPADMLLPFESTEEIREVQDVKTSLLGLWQSRGDVQFTREFTANGAIIDTYGGPEHAEVSGTWEVFTAEDTSFTAPFPLQSGDTYIRVVIDGGGYHYRVDSVSATSLELVYMDRGGVLSFTKVR